MISLIARRLAGALTVILVVATAAFLLLRLAPGGPFDQRRMTPEVKKNLEHAYGLDRPLHVQYLTYLGGLVRGELGPSLKRPDRTVNEIISTHFPYSLVLGLVSLAMATLLGLGLAMVAAARRHTWVDNLCMGVSQIGLSVPSFVLAPLLILFFALKLAWLPPAGVDGLSSYLLPAFALAFALAGVVARLARASLIETMQQDYIRTARAKGLTEVAIFLRHALRPSMVPVLVWLGPTAAALITGSIVIESIFQIPGLGYYFVSSATDRDYTVMTGILVFYSAILVALNFAVDVAHSWIDPRLRRLA